MARTKLTSNPNRRGKAKAKTDRSDVEKETLHADASAVKKERKKHRWHPGTVALRGITKAQKSTEPFLKHAPLKRIIKQIMDDMAKTSSDPTQSAVRITKGAVRDLIDVSDAFMGHIMAEMQMEAIKANRTTIMPRDLYEVKRLHIDGQTMGKMPQHAHELAIRYEHKVKRQAEKRAEKETELKSQLESQLKKENVPAHAEEETAPPANGATADQLEESTDEEQVDSPSAA